MARLAASLPLTVAFVAALSALAVGTSVGLFGLSLTGGLALYFVIWWIGLFAVLPFAARNQPPTPEVDHVGDPGAPALPRLRETALWTTVVAAAVLIAASALMPLAGL